MAPYAGIVQPRGVIAADCPHGYIVAERQLVERVVKQAHRLDYLALFLQQRHPEQCPAQLPVGGVDNFKYVIHRINAVNNKDGMRWNIFNV